MVSCINWQRTERQGIDMKLTFWGAAHEVTGSCHMITVGDRHFLVDCGMEQGPDLYENQKLSVKPSDIDFVFLLTHILTTQVLFLYCAKTDFQAILFQPLQLLIYVQLCLRTVLTYRSLRHNGETVRQNEPINQCMSLSIQWRMQKLPFHFSIPVIIMRK